MNTRLIAFLFAVLQDREDVAQYVLIVVAVNTYSDYQLSSTAQVVVRVVDVNDETPKFKPASYESSINELASNQTYILTVKATDEDDPLVKSFNMYLNLF